MAGGKKNKRVGNKNGGGGAVMRDAAPSATDSATNYEEELNWCIRQLNLGLKTKNPDQKQKEETHKYLKTLESTKSPLVKKRFLMNKLFGDYRAKMKAESEAEKEKQLKILSLGGSGALSRNGESVQIKKVSAEDYKMKFFRKARCATTAAKSATVVGEQNKQKKDIERNSEVESKTFEKEEFKFDFFSQSK
eukprot:Nk52_evm4s2635 gene=Nk52_evmTU4s2635